MIRRVIVKNYRALRSADVEFRVGTTLLVGNNECGKSTLLEAIRLALTGRIGRLPVRDRLHPWLFNTDVVKEFVAAARDGQPDAPPEILIEVYLERATELERWRGSINSRRQDCPGVVFKILLDQDCRGDYTEYISRGRDVSTIPIEYFTVEWLSFANERLTPRRLPLKTHLVDSSSGSLDRSSGRYLLEIVENHLNREQRIDLAIAYRRLKESFQEEDGVVAVNDHLSNRQGQFSSKTLSVGLDTLRDLRWEDGVIPHLDSIPMPLVGLGEQSASRIWLALHAVHDSDVFLVEEPENHLSYTSLHALVERLAAKVDGKQLIMTTHSSFVVNKLGLDEVVLFNRGVASRLTDLEPSTRDYFRKLPGHDTLRLILARKAILVEGPSDELVLQRAYRERHGRTALQGGVDIISVRSLAFRRFLAVADLLETRVDAVMDNDGKPDRVQKRYSDFDDHGSIRILYSSDPRLRTLEPQMIAANGLAGMNQILGKDFGDEQALEAWMLDNKTEAALRVFDWNGPVSFPDYIWQAVDE